MEAEAVIVLLAALTLLHSCFRYVIVEEEQIMRTDDTLIKEFIYYKMLFRS